MELRCLLPFLLAWVLLPYLVSTQQYVVFNTSSPCAVNGLCNFTDNSAWNGGVVPDLQSSVLINITYPVTVFTDSTVEIESLELGGNVTFLVTNNATLKVNSSVIWYSSAAVHIESSTCYASRFYGSSMLLTSSVLYAGSAELSILYATGSELYVYDALYIKSYAAIESGLVNCSWLVIGSTGVFNNTRVQTQELSLEFNTTITLANAQDIFLGNIACQTKLIFTNCAMYLDNVSVVFSYSDAKLIADNIVIVTIEASNRAAYMNRVIQNPNAQVFINCNTNIYFIGNNTIVSANLYLGTSGALQTYPNYVLSFTNSAGVCNITGPGSIDVDYGATLNCNGTITIANMTLASQLNVKTLNVMNSLVLQNSGTVPPTITGDVYIVGGIQLFNPITIVGDFELVGSDNKYDPDILVNVPEYYYMLPIMNITGTARITSYSTEIEYAEFDEGELLLVDAHKIAKSSFKSIKGEQELYARKRGEKIFIEVREEDDWDWIGKNWIIFLVVCVVTFGLAILMARFIKRILATKQVGDLGTALPSYFASFKFSRLKGWGKFELVLLLILYFPFIIEAGVYTIALAALIPLGFVFGLVEHKFVFLWAVLTLFIQVGGLLDIFADLILLTKTTVWMIGLQFGKDEDMEFRSDDDIFLWAARFALTCFGSLVTISLAFSLTSRLGRVLDGLSGKKIFYKGKDADMPIATTGLALFFLAIVLVLCWKIMLIAMRLYLLVIVLQSLIKYRRLEESVQRRVQWIESVLYLDLVWSGLPLGVLTMLEMFYFSKDLELGKDQIFELIKLGALAVDLMGASFLVWFIVFGLIKKIPLLHHHHHEHHSPAKPAAPTETQPLIQDKHDDSSSIINSSQIDISKELDPT